MARSLVDYRVRRGSSSRWELKNPILDSGEWGYETDTGKFKIGNGLSRWLDLPYFVDEEGVQAMVEAQIALSPPGADTRIGDMTALTTTEKTTVVGALNEINVPTVPLDLLYDNAKAG